MEQGICLSANGSGFMELLFQGLAQLLAEVQLTQEWETLIWFPKGSAVISLSGLGGVRTPD